MSTQEGVLALRRATRALIWALAASAASTLALLVALARQYAGAEVLLMGQFLTDEAAVSLDRHTAVLGAAASVASGAVLAVFAWWMYCAHRVAARRELPGPVARPVDAMLSALVPVVNLVRPYQLVLQLTEALRDPRVARGTMRLRGDAERQSYRGRVAELLVPEAEPPAPASVVVWGILWGCGRLLATLAATMTTPVGDVSRMELRIGLAALASVLGLGAAWLTWRITAALGATLPSPAPSPPSG